MAADPLLPTACVSWQRPLHSVHGDRRPWAGCARRAHVTRETPVAYFCAEYGVHSSLPLYSGGLGILAGDHLKSASDLNVPLVAVGLVLPLRIFSAAPQCAKIGRKSHYRESHSPTNFRSKRSRMPKDNRSADRSGDARSQRVRASVWRARRATCNFTCSIPTLPENARGRSAGHWSPLWRHARNTSGAGDDAGHWRRAAAAETRKLIRRISHQRRTLGFSFAGADAGNDRDSRA